MCLRSAGRCVFPARRLARGGPDNGVAPWFPPLSVTVWQEALVGGELAAAALRKFVHDQAIDVGLDEMRAVIANSTMQSYLIIPMAKTHAP